MRVCCALSSDAAFFHQAEACIDTLRAAIAQVSDHVVDIAFVAIGLTQDQIAWLRRREVNVHADLSEFPRFPHGPDHAYALTCRPYLPWVFPDYDAYIWIDCDIRFLTGDGLAFYLDALADPVASIIVAQETEPCYGINAQPKLARPYHATRVQRMRQVYDMEVVHYFQYFNFFNAGLFAARADSPFWTRFRRNLQKALTVPYSVADDQPGDQDAMNVSIIEVGNWIRAPSVMNWLCSLAMPVQAGDGTWRDPSEPIRQIHVAHLTNSSALALLPEGPRTFYATYRSAGLTV